MMILTETVIEAKQTLQELEAATACARMKMNEVMREVWWLREEMWSLENK